VQAVCGSTVTGLLQLFESPDPDLAPEQLASVVCPAVEVIAHERAPFSWPPPQGADLLET
jgi:hypothetical protein